MLFKIGGALFFVLAVPLMLYGLVGDSRLDTVHGLACMATAYGMWANARLDDLKK